MGKIIGNKKIIIADDLEINQILLEEMLSPYNFEIIKCKNGKKCVEKFFEIKDIDLILMDLDMPVLDGYEATKIIRTKDKHVPIIAQTAYTQKENKERAFSLGFNDFLSKPVKIHELIRVVLKNLKEREYEKI